MFIINGKREFIEDFEKFLIENKIQYSRPILGERTEEREQEGIENRMKMIISPDMARDIISIAGATATFLKMLYYWYTSRKSKGTISIQTAEGTMVELNDKIIKILISKKKRSKKKKSTRKTRRRNR